MTSTADPDIAQTVASAVAGDELAFARIVSAHHGEMVRICVFVSRDTAVAEDAVQAAWLIAWRKLGSVRDSERLRSWLSATKLVVAGAIEAAAERRDIEDRQLTHTIRIDDGIGTPVAFEGAILVPGERGRSRNATE